MSKKKRRKGGEAGTTGADAPGTSGPVEDGPGLSRTGKKTILAGIVLIAVGFFVLTYADPMGRNWAAGLCPFLILGGYGVVGWGIFRDDPEKTIKADAPPTDIAS